jgi:hypothetical protein
VAEVLAGLGQPEPELGLKLEPEPPAGPMAEFDEAAVLAWLGTVPGLTAAQRVAAAAEMVADEHNGSERVRGTAQTLRRLLKGTAAEAAVPALLAARDACLAAEPAAVPGCQICFEAYGSVHRHHAKQVQVAFFESRDPPAAGTL